MLVLGHKHRPGRILSMLVFASVGSASGALSPALDVAIILMVILTTFLAPPLLRVVFGEEPFL